MLENILLELFLAIKVFYMSIGITFFVLFAALVCIILPILPFYVAFGGYNILKEIKEYRGYEPWMNE